MNLCQRQQQETTTDEEFDFPFSIGQYCDGRGKTLVTKNYRHLKKLLLPRCDHDLWREHQLEIETSEAYLGALPQLSEDEQSYLMDRPLFDQFEPLPREVIHRARQQVCETPECKRIDCDLYHICPGADPPADGWCFCTKTRIVHMFLVRNIHTDRRAWVGSTCIDHFSQEIQREYAIFVRQMRGSKLREKLIPYLLERDGERMPEAARKQLELILQEPEDDELCRKFDQWSKERREAQANEDYSAPSAPTYGDLEEQYQRRNNPESLSLCTLEYFSQPSSQSSVSDDNLTQSLTPSLTSSLVLPCPDEENDSIYNDSDADEDYIDKPREQSPKEHRKRQVDKDYVPSARPDKKRRIDPADLPAAHAPSPFHVYTLAAQSERIHVLKQLSLAMKIIMDAAATSMQKSNAQATIEQFNQSHPVLVHQFLLG